MKHRRSKKRRNGFSLVELLTVITIITVIASISLPSIGSINDAAHLAKNQRNAQYATSIVNAARIAGHDFVANAAHPNSQHSILHAVTAGATITDPGNVFEDTFFGVPDLSEEDIVGAESYLEVVSGELRYKPEGDSVDPLGHTP